MPKTVVYDTATRMLHYNVLNNILYLNKLFFKFKKVPFPLRSFCKLEEETALHLFQKCIETQILLQQSYSFCNDSFSFSVSTLQTATSEYINTNNENELLINNLFLTFKM